LRQNALFFHGILERYGDVHAQDRVSQPNSRAFDAAPGRAKGFRWQIKRMAGGRLAFKMTAPRPRGRRPKKRVGTQRRTPLQIESGQNSAADSR
jgi:hypothetical protein